MFVGEDYAYTIHLKRSYENDLMSFDLTIAINRWQLTGLDHRIACQVRHAPWWLVPEEMRRLGVSKLLLFSEWFEKQNAGRTGADLIIAELKS